MNHESGPNRKLKYKYLDKSLNHSLHKIYRSPSKKQNSYICCRRSSIEDFSPYKTIDNEHGRIKNNLFEQIMLQNQLLNNQLSQYRIIVSKLQDQLKEKAQQLRQRAQQNRQRTVQIQSLEQALTENNIYYENVIKQMKGQIQLILSKNFLLEGEIVKIGQLRAKQRHLSQSLKQQQINLRQELSEIILNNQNKIIQCQLENSTRKKMIKSGRQLKCYIESLLRRNNTLEQFIKSITEMKKKIENDQNSDLKSLWKWLKTLGQQYNYFKKIKKPLMKILNISADKPIQQIIEKLLVQELKIII